MRLRKRQGEDFNMAFLDIICCGFGAIILLLMITKVVEPGAVEETPVENKGLIETLQEQLFQVRNEAKVVNRAMTVKQEQLSEVKDYIARLQGDLSAIKGQFQASDGSSDVNEVLEGQLSVAKQSLTAEMKRLLGSSHKRSNNIIGGLPVDSEYLIFIIDTSGSMFQTAWPRLQKELIATLDVYPKVKGIQIMNDMGNYMFSSYRGKWIPDSPKRRQVLIRTLRNWSPFSNSSPVEGISAAVRRYYDGSKKISLFVYGDDFSGGSIQRVIQEIDSINRVKADGSRLVRIHAVGFPHLIAAQRNVRSSSARFAALMREMTYRNDGTFVGLTPE